MGISWQELILVLVIVLVLFGPKRLPEVGRSLGNGIREFRDTMSGNGPTASPIEAEATSASTTNVAAVKVATPAAADQVPAGADSTSK
ncbi:MAG: twin-arginine translocase TatA/TatE family subunit [Thermoleophilia bacterium]|nr:twin-arginine translocase TatA/TatE family subunit [Thermoleophilia bacterium]